MADKDDGLGLGLSLSLRFPENQHLNLNLSPPRLPPAAASVVLVPFPLNLFRSPLPFLQPQHKPSNTDAFQLSADRSGEPRSYFRGIDVNRAITVIDCDEEAMASSPNSTISSVSDKRSEREENEAERASSSFEMEDDGGEAARKKLRLSKEQAAVLEETFKEHNTLNPELFGENKGQLEIIKCEEGERIWQQCRGRNRKGFLASRLINDEDDDGSNGRRKLRLTKVQSALLGESFKIHSTLNPTEPFLEQFAKRSSLNQALIGSAGNLVRTEDFLAIVEGGKDEEGDLELER